MSKIDPVQNARRVLNISRRVRTKVKTRLGVGKDFVYNVDNPRKSIIDTQTIVVDGWIIPKKPMTFELRVRNNENVYPVEFGVRRIDVVKSHPDISTDDALHSGFRSKFKLEDGEVAVELNIGKGFKKLYSTQVRYSTEHLPASLYNKDLAWNYAEHTNLLENRQSFYYEDRLEATYERAEKDARAIAIYLPQFHPFPENDKAWGRGFTEWNNVTTGSPRFIGHQQPILPKDLGFYDLRLESKILEQINLAKKYGIYGFCFYYYWFSGKKLMESPLESVLRHKEWDFNFTICWANENWTKRWDGRDDDVIIAQEYLDEDPLNFIREVEPILLDKRYIKEDGKPVLMVYRASELKDPRRYAEIWREYFRSKHKLELQLVSFLSFDDADPREYGFDAALDFAPLSAFFKNRLFPDKRFPYVRISEKLLDTNFNGVVADYRSIALNEKLRTAYSFPTYTCLTPSWDNDARKKGKGFVYQNSSPDLYARWLDGLVKQETAKRDAPLIFINAWNEWAEGAIMEPSMHLGHAVLNRTVETLSKYSHNNANATNFPSYDIKREPGKRLAVVVHLYYPDLWPLIASRLSCITEPYDLFVTLNARNKDFVVSLEDKSVRINTFVLPNRGRDVLPFIYVAQRLRAAGYEYFLKLHSKKSKHRADGSSWFGEVINNLLPGEETIAKTVSLLKDPGTGLIGPDGHLVSLKVHMGSNQPLLEDMLSRVYDKSKTQKVLASPERYPYFGGTMFWARLDAISPILDLHLMPDDFQSEHGQIDGTLAHAIERLFCIVARQDGRILYTVKNNTLAKVTDDPYVKKYTYAP